MIEIRVDDLSATLSGRTVLDHVTFALRGGSLIGLIGPNAAGKTTLIRALAGLQEPSHGKILLDGKSLRDLDAKTRARLIGYLAQGAVCHWPLTVERLVALGRLPHLDAWRRAEPADFGAVQAALLATDTAELRQRGVFSLSGGERARVLLARALAVEPKLLLADEPVAGLDPYHQLQVMEILLRRAENGAAVVVVLHDLSLAKRFCNRLILIDRGQLIADGAPADVLTDRNLAEVYAITAAHGRHGGEDYLVPWRRLAPGKNRHARP